MPLVTLLSSGLWSEVVRPCHCVPLSPTLNQLGSKPGVEDKAMDVAIVHIHHHQRGAFLAQLLVGQRLHLAVNGEIDILARLAGILAQFANDAAIGIDLDAGRAGAAADFLFIGLSMPRLPIFMPGRFISGSSSLCWSCSDTEAT